MIRRRRHGRQAAGALYGRAREAARRHHRVHPGAFYTDSMAQLSRSSTFAHTGLHRSTSTAIVRHSMPTDLKLPHTREL